MNVIVVGGNGQLGADVVDAFKANGDHVSALAHSDIELSNPDSITACLRGLEPDLVVNTAAMHHVENCEREPEKAFAINACGARNMALLARKIGAVLIHVSTDYVFDGKKNSPYVETDLTGPLNVYGNTKLAGEHFVRSTADRYFVLRTSAIYGKNPCRAKGGLNFVELMLKLAKERDEVRVVNDEIVTPTPTVEIAKQMVVLSRSDKYGLYHATSSGSCSWHEFARAIFSLTNTKVNLQMANSNEFPAKVTRPKYSVLENRALAAHGLNAFGSWEQGLRGYLFLTNRLYERI